MSGRVGLTPVPDDGDISAFLFKIQNEHFQILRDRLEALVGTINQTRSDNEPDIFAYGKLMNYLASDDVDEPELLAMCASAMWYIIRQEERSADAQK